VPTVDDVDGIAEAWDACVEVLLKENLVSVDVLDRANSPMQ
jgi:hypothetical protein